MRVQAFLVIAAAAVAMVAQPSAAADLTILGREMVVRSDGSGNESSRRVVVVGKEAATELAAIGDPRAGGATLVVVTQGASAAAQSFLLEPGGWTAAPHGYRYRKPKGAGGHPVSSVTIRAVPGGAAMIRFVLRGDVGSDTLDVVPPNPGTGGGISLQVQGGPRYCVRLGGPAGGVVTASTATRWRIARATAEAGCLEPPPPAVCGNGVVDSGEVCDGSASPACDDPFGPAAACGAPDNPVHACSCCYPAGTTYSTILLGSDGYCCDATGEFPLNPYERYCGDCLPDGAPCLSGAGACCSGECFADGVPVPICGGCLQAGAFCSPGLPEYCCSGSCQAGGVCD